VGSHNQANRANSEDSQQPSRAKQANRSDPESDKQADRGNRKGFATATQRQRGNSQRAENPDSVVKAVGKQGKKPQGQEMGPVLGYDTGKKGSSHGHDNEKAESEQVYSAKIYEKNSGYIR